MFLNYAKCDLLKFTLGVLCPGGGGGLSEEFCPRTIKNNHQMNVSVAYIK